MSVIYTEVGRHDEAIYYAEQSISLCREMCDLHALPMALNSQACLYMENALYDQAEKILMEALETVKRHPSPRMEALLRNNIAMCHLNDDHSLENIAFAAAHLSEGILLSRKATAKSLEALCSGNLALVRYLEGKYPEAERLMCEAADIYRPLGILSSLAAIRCNLGNLYREGFKDSEKAVRAYSESIELLEQVRKRLKKETHRIGIAESGTEPYRMIIATLLELGRVEEAFHYTERAKSRALVEFLTVRLHDVVDSAAIKQATRFLRGIDELRSSLEEIREVDETERGRNSGRDETDISTDEILCQLEEKERSFDQACAELLEVEPYNQDLVSVQAPSLAEIQSLLPADTILIELFQTEESLEVFLLSQKDTVRTVSIPISGEEGEEVVWTLLTAMRETKGIPTRSHDYLRSVHQPLSQLYDRLIAPLTKYLGITTRVIIIPHLFWHYLPFHALYDRQDKRYLADQFEIAYASSASLLKLCLGKERFDRERAVFLCRNNGDLPHVEREGELLYRAFEGESYLFTGTEARLDRIEGLQNKPDIIHFACHGQFVHEQPFLSGLDIPPDAEEERPTFLLDFFRQRFDCSLVTLSACDSGLSRITSADELIGLSRGLFYAGAASVMLSLWQVADESTSHLMENFYWHYAKNKLTKSRALQLAMKLVRAKPEYAHPHYWAPFVVMGDWR
jgi:CHAT domain-containing protein